MLVLSGNPGKSIRIADDIVVTIVSVSGRKVRLGIEAPRSIPVVREELLPRAGVGQIGRSTISKEALNAVTQ